MIIRDNTNSNYEHLLCYVCMYIYEKISDFVSIISNINDGCVTKAAMQEFLVLHDLVHIFVTLVTLSYDK